MRPGFMPGVPGMAGGFPQVHVLFAASLSGLEVSITTV
jgi:hypothetical protein